MLYARFSVHKFTTVTEGSFQLRRHDYHVLWHKYYVPLYFQEKYLADGLVSRYQVQVQKKQQLETIPDVRRQVDIILDVTGLVTGVLICVPSDAIGNFTATHDIKNQILITLTRSTGIGTRIHFYEERIMMLKSRCQ